MAKAPSPPPPPPGRGGTPAGGSSPSQATLDRPWRIWASVVVVVALALGALIGLVVIPAGQKENAHLSMGEAMRRAAGLEAGSPAVPQPLAKAAAVPVSQVAWTPEIMAILQSGNTGRGAALAAESCAACHGDKGLSMATFPSLAGQSAPAIYKQLHDFKTGARVNDQMTPIALALSDRDLAAVSAYYAHASREYAAIGKRDLLGEPDIVRLASEGDSRRRIPACLSCHVNGAGGPIETPVITGQLSEYSLKALNDFASGARRNDVYGRMRDISRKLTPREREALARYFQGTL